MSGYGERKIFISDIKTESAIEQEVRDQLKAKESTIIPQSIEELRQTFSSIPTPWAKYEFYKKALLDEKNPYHNLVFNDWLGILALILMQKLRNIRVQIKEVELDKALKDFLPEEIKNTVDDKVPVIFRNTEPIALFIQPIIVMGKLIYEFEGSDIHMELPWIDFTGKEFKENRSIVRNVLYCESIPLDERVEFAKKVWKLLNKTGYIDKSGKVKAFELRNIFKKKLEEFKNKKLSNYPDLYENLSTFMDEIENEAFSSNLQPVSVKGLEELVLEPKNIEGFKLSHYLASDILFGEKRKDYVDYVLLPNPGTKDDYENKRIIPGFSNTFTNRQWLSRNTNKINEILEKNFNLKIINIDRLFYRAGSSRPYIFKFNDNFVAIPVNVNYLQQIEKEVLYNLIKRIEISDDFSKLTLKLMDEGDERNKDNTAVYSRSLDIYEVLDGLSDKEKVFEIALFPYLNNFDSPVLAIAISEKLQSKIKVEIEEEYVKDSTVERVQFDGVDIIIKLYHLKQIPPYILIGKQGEDDYNIFLPGMVLNRDKNSYYMNFKTPEEKKKYSAGTVEFAIDVGTSNTYIAYKEEGKDEIYDFDFSLDNLYLENAAETKILKQFFIINKEEFSEIFPTLIRQRNTNSKKPLLGTHIYWGKIDDTKKDKRKHLYDKIEHNIKWGETDRERELLKSFLKQTFYHISIFSWKKGYNKITIKYTYPNAFPQELLTNYNKTWEDALKEIKEMLPSNGPEIQLFDKAIPEAVAVAEYARGLEAQNFLAIDIGGGTTDVALWRNGNLENIWSLKFAGNHILLDNIFCFEYKEKCKEDPQLSENTTERKLFKLWIETNPEIIDEKLNNIKLKELVLVSYSILLSEIYRIIKDSKIKNEEILALRFFGNGSQILIKELNANSTAKSSLRQRFQAITNQIILKLTGVSELKKSVAKGAVKINTVDNNMEIKFKEPHQDKDILEKLKNDLFDEDPSFIQIFINNKERLEQLKKKFEEAQKERMHRDLTSFLVNDYIPKLRELYLQK